MSLQAINFYSPYEEGEMVIAELLIARFIIGCVFIVSGLGKLFSFPSLKDEILDYGLPLSDGQVQTVAYSLPFVELILGVLNFVGFSLRIISLLEIFLLLIFTCAIAINVRRGRRFSCHCFGSSSAVIGPMTILRNGLLLALAFWIFLSTSLTVSLVSSVILWHSEMQLVTHIDILIPIIGSIFLSLGILFILGEMNPIFIKIDT